MKSRQAETQRFSSLTIIRLWLANKKTSSNQRGANGVTAASWHTENHVRIIEASNAGVFVIFRGLTLRVLDRIQAEITTLKRKMDNEDPENKDPSYVNAKCDWMMLTNQISAKKNLFNLTTCLKF